MTQYIYLLQTREFVNSKEPIYKIGKTTKLNFTRFNQYPQGSVLLFQSSCFDCNKLEKEIIQLFKSKYKVRRSIGRESFEGNSHEMIKDFCDFINNEQNVVGEEVVEEKIVEGITEDVVEEGVVEEIDDEIDDEIVVEVKVINDSEMLVNTNTIIEARYIQKNENGKTMKKRTKLCCRECGYFTDVKTNLNKHLNSKKHALNATLSTIVFPCDNICKNCDKRYNTHSGLWKHLKSCKTPIVPEIIVPESTIDLHKKFDNLERIVAEMGNKITNKYKQN